MDMEQHLNSLFPPLKFPPELAARILTHTSHPDAIYRHNARLSFIGMPPKLIQRGVIFSQDPGRRILQTYLHLFLHSSPALHPTHDYSQISQRALNTYVLGEHVAPLWSFGKVMKWTPVAGPLLSTPTARQEGPVAVLSRLGPEASRSVGLYKVQGTAVEALVGGVFHQFVCPYLLSGLRTRIDQRFYTFQGGSVAHRLFHTRVLPNILVPGRPEGLPDVFHEHVMEVCDSMGGLKGDLLAAESAASES